MNKTPINGRKVMSDKTGKNSINSFLLEKSE
jgi:hypothetical protein